MIYKLITLEDCIKIQRKLGFNVFWTKFIKSYLHIKRPDLQLEGDEFELDMESSLFDIENISEIYENLLVEDNKTNKKDLGKYYTPKDVSVFMSKKLLEMYENGDNICDVGCGCGNLIINVLSLLPKEKVLECLHNKNIFLYDYDEISINITLMKICLLFLPKGDIELYNNISKQINIVKGNFLSDRCVLPKQSLVISNPPYCSIPKKLEIWLGSECVNTGNLYSLFMEKIVKQCKNGVIITPQTFVGGKRYEILRDVLSQYGGIVYCFDNVPSPIFCGKKKGIFNSNTSNSVRVGITIINKQKKGFQITPMIRFKSEERGAIFSNVDKVIGNKVYRTKKSWMKIPKKLEVLVDTLLDTHKTLKDLIELDKSKQKEKFKLNIPSTPRYFISGVSYPLKRSSMIEIYGKDKTSFNKLYVILNSSLSYLWWRIQDGEITITKETLLSTPVPIFSNDIEKVVDEGVSMEKKYLTTKLNSQKNNENVKFPVNYRKKLNKIIISSIPENIEENVLLSIHSNSFNDVIPLWI